MPKSIERAIIREYRKHGYSLKRARSIAFATMVKRGLWRPQAHHRRKGKRRGRR